METVNQSQPLPFSKLDRSAALERVKKNDSEGFRRNMDTLIRLAKHDGADVILLGFLLARKEHISKAREDFKGLEEHLVLGVKKHHKIMAELSRKYEVLLIIPDQNLFKDEWFQDDCHLNEEGEKIKAGILYQYIVAHNLIPCD